ncbi:MAG: hypothetical protein CMJ12_01175 [Pelagibacterales bacterium]|nr:hypothetical protein [Pelagibacterales bacterium]PPR16613.1 MAG: hypothetical protein CFH33_00517 [Alphaproteobacteria bacterium MarineAlpha9_Bin3]
MKKNTNKIDKNILNLLVCPITKGPLKYDIDKSELISEKAKLAFPIEDGIPIMLIDKARRLK